MGRRPGERGNVVAERGFAPELHCFSGLQMDLDDASHFYYMTWLLDVRAKTIQFMGGLVLAVSSRPRGRIERC